MVNFGLSQLGLGSKAIIRSFIPHAVGDVVSQREPTGSKTGCR
jgi:hypothetical protein